MSFQKAGHFQTVGVTVSRVASKLASNTAAFRSSGIFLLSFIHSFVRSEPTLGDTVLWAGNTTLKERAIVPALAELTLC